MSAKIYAKRSHLVAARKLGNEMMIMSAPDSTLFTLNETATILWEAADGSSSLEEIVADKICSRFDTSLEQALRDAAELARELAGHGILLLSEVPHGASKALAQVAR